MFRWFSFGKTRKSSGFALVDIILGIAILSVALVGIAFAYRQSTVTTVVARNYNQATYYAQQALEKLKVNDGHIVGKSINPIRCMTRLPKKYQYVLCGSYGI